MNTKDQQILADHIEQHLPDDIYERGLSRKSNNPLGMKSGNEILAETMEEFNNIFGVKDSG